MMDAIAFLNNPYFFYPALFAIISIPLILMLARPKAGTVTIGFERLRVGFVNIGVGRMSKGKNDSDYKLKLNDGRTFIVPKEKVDEAEIVNSKSKITIPKGVVRLFPIEKGQLTHFNGSLTEQTNPLLDNESVSAVQNRGSLRILARLTGALGGGYMMLLLAACAAFAVGYIMYPQFNHPAPIIECFKQLPNGTRILQGFC